GPLLVDLPERQVPPVADRRLVVLREGGQRLPLRSVVADRVIELLPVLRPSDRDPSPPRPPTVAGEFVDAAVTVWQTHDPIPPPRVWTETPRPGQGCGPGESPLD